jgi:polyhydroxybutyrate depolymerase
MKKNGTLYKNWMLIIICTAVSTSIAQFQSGSFEFDGVTREYQVFLPQDFQSDMPVVLNLHGYNVGIINQKNYTFMHEFADTSGFIIVFPGGSMGSSISWNNGFRDHPTIWTDSTSNDVGFISALIDTIDAHYDIDLSRVYSCGWSMGGEMTYRLAVELGHRFAAVASVAGKLNDVSGNIGNPIRPFPVLHFHGTADSVEHYGPGVGNLWSAEDTRNFWLQNNDCVLDPGTVTLPDIDQSDGSTVEKISYTNCSDDVQYIFYKILNGGHGWPGGTDRYEGGVVGLVNRDIYASDIILEFFKNYQNPLVNIGYATSKEVFPKCISKQGDSLQVTAQLRNSAKHPMTVYAIMTGRQSTFKDSVKLFDDGEHWDGDAADDIFGGKKWFSDLYEDIYALTLRVTDNQANISTFINHPTYITSIGPIKLDIFEITNLFGTLFTLKLTLKNEGVESTAQNITVQLATIDDEIVKLTVPVQNGINIEAGHSVEVEESIMINIPDSIKIIPINVKIFSHGQYFWTDTFEIDLTSSAINQQNIIPLSFKMSQNYPNPFNPRTIINYELPIMNYVELIIYNIIGDKVVTLISERQEAGYHQVEWDASGLASGVYYYRIQAGNYTDVKKMIFIK